MPDSLLNRTEEVSMSRVVHFEIQADDVERAKSFYASVFDTLEHLVDGLLR